jgi:hypothetical protein
LYCIVVDVNNKTPDLENMEDKDGSSASAMTAKKPRIEKDVSSVPTVLQEMGSTTTTFENDIGLYIGKQVIINCV